MYPTHLGKKHEPVTVHGIGESSTATSPRNTPALIPLPRQVSTEPSIHLGEETEPITVLPAIGSTGSNTPGTRTHHSRCLGKSAVHVPSPLGKKHEVDHSFGTGNNRERSAVVTVMIMIISPVIMIINMMTMPSSGPSTPEHPTPVRYQNANTLTSLGKKNHLSMYLPCSGTPKQRPQNHQNATYTPSTNQKPSILRRNNAHSPRQEKGTSIENTGITGHPHQQPSAPPPLQPSAAPPHTRVNHQR